MSFKDPRNLVTVDLPGPPTADPAPTTASSVRSEFGVTSSATPHSVTGASWQQVDASLSTDVSGIIIQANANTNSTGANSSTLLEIGVGGSGAETVWATVLVGYRVRPMAPTHIPGFIAAGTRVSIRLRSVVASRTLTFQVSFVPKQTGAELLAPVSYGINTATSQGVTLTAPGVLNTKSAWTTIGTLSEPASVMGWTVQGAGGGAMSSTGVLLDIGYDSGGGDTVLAGDIWLAGDGTEGYQVVSAPTAFTCKPGGLALPTGTLLRARYQRAASGNGVDLAIVCAGEA